MKTDETTLFQPLTIVGATSYASVSAIGYHDPPPSEFAAKYAEHDTLRVVSSDLVVEGAWEAICDVRVVTPAEASSSRFENSITRIVIVARIEESSVRTSMRMGAHAVISPGISVDDARAVFSAVVAGYYPIPHHLARNVATRLEDPGPRRVSDRDLTILSQLAHGKTMAELATELGFSERHTRRQVRSLWKAMGVDGRIQGLIAAAQQGLLEEDPPTVSDLQRKS